jgi:hypothetical protein
MGLEARPQRANCIDRVSKRVSSERIWRVVERLGERARAPKNRLDTTGGLAQ